MSRTLQVYCMNDSTESIFFNERSAKAHATKMQTKQKEKEAEALKNGGIQPFIYCHLHEVPLAPNQVEFAIYYQEGDQRCVINTKDPLARQCMCDGYNALLTEPLKAAIAEWRDSAIPGDRFTCRRITIFATGSGREETLFDEDNP